MSSPTASICTIIGGKISGIMKGDAEKLMEDEFAWNDQRLAGSAG